jgi:hypothetical protein
VVAVDKTSTRRLSGNQLVVCVVAVCAALVLTPAGVYAAKVQKVKVVGKVPTTVQNTVAAQVTGTVTAAPAPPATGFWGTVRGDGEHPLAPYFGSGSTIHVTSLSVANTGSTVLLGTIPHPEDAACQVKQGAVYAYLVVPPFDTRTVTFPTPVDVTQRCAAIFMSTANGIATITGYR